MLLREFRVLARLNTMSVHSNACDAYAACGSTRKVRSFPLKIRRKIKS